MEQPGQQSSSFYESSFVKTQKNHRSLPIPKVVNNFVLKKFGESYYLSQDVSEKSAILQQIENELKASGYNISWCEIERRLKNMKSHYRRKKSDLERGLAASVEWEYFRELDRIFANQEKTSSSGDEAKVFRPAVASFKRKAEPESVTQPAQEQTEPKPQDL